jgi:hypothetical protein
MLLMRGKFMRKNIYLTSILICLISAATAFGQRETFTGTAVIYGSGFNTRTITRTFTLNINGRTSDRQAQRFLDILQESGQDDLLREINNENLGSFSLGGTLGRRLNVVRESVVDGQRRVFVVFERWLGFGEIRGGYRSVDYPFSVIEIFVDERTGRGEGTYIPAARVRFRIDRKTGQNTVEIENFATFPAKLMGVRLRRN